MRERIAAFVCALAVVAGAHSARAAVLEVPANGASASGIGSISGWKCPPNDNITIVIDGGAPIPIPSGVRRGDTASICGNDGRNGFITQMNFGNLGDGQHSISVRRNGQQFASGTFRVTTFGQSFVSGVSGSYTLQNFPSAGRSATVEWSEGAQNFIITGATGTGPITPTPTPKPQPTPTSAAGCPASGPVKDLRVNCEDHAFYYVKGGVVAGLTSDGDILAMCITSVTSSDIICTGGDVLSATTFDLQISNLNGGLYVPLGSGSGGSISASGQSLSFRVILDGETFDFPGLAYSSRSALGASTSADVVGDSVLDVLDALRGGAVHDSLSSGAEPAEAAAAVGDALRRMLE